MLGSEPNAPPEAPEAERRPPRSVDGPGARLQTAGGLLLALAVPAIFIFYIVVLSPIAPARYYRRLEGIEDFGAGLAAWLGALIAALVLTGLALYFAGTRKERRARR